MKLPFDYSPYVSYKSLDLQGGPRLHFISCQNEFPDLVSVSVTVNFGGIHLACADVSDNVHDFPQGMAHFMEHFLFWLNFSEIVKPLELKYAASLNAVVTADRTIWYLKRALVDDRLLEDATKWGTVQLPDEVKKNEAICDILKGLISVAIGIDESRKDHFIELIDKSVTDIRNEISERHTGFMTPNIKSLNLTLKENSKRRYDYALQVILRSVLYQNNPIRYDWLGSKETLQKITLTHVEKALELIRNNILSIVVVGHTFSEKTVTEAKQTVEEILRTYTIQSNIRPISPGEEPLVVTNPLRGVHRDSSINTPSLAMLGIKLLPLQQLFPSPEIFKHSYLLNYLAMNYIRQPIRGLVSQHSRFYFIGTNIEDPFFFLDIDSCYRVIKDLKLQLVQRLLNFQRNFDTWIADAYVAILSNPIALMKLCHAADLFGFKLSDLLNSFNVIQPSDLDPLILELKEAKNNVALVYTGEFVDLFT